MTHVAGVVSVFVVFVGVVVWWHGAGIRLVLAHSLSSMFIIIHVGDGVKRMRG